mgnify:CR=1 FL=1
MYNSYHDLTAIKTAPNIVVYQIYAEHIHT